MAQYENFFSDFGLRCFDLYDHAGSLNMDGPRDVTTAICVLAGALTIPHERLRPILGRDHKPLPDHCFHPKGDAVNVNFAKAAKKYQEILQQPFRKRLGQDGTWQIGEGKLVWGEPDKWQYDSPKNITDQKQSSSVLRMLRNSLAHGNVDTESGDGGKTINSIRFVGIVGELRRQSDRKNGTEHKMQFVTVSTKDLSKFMTQWKAVLLELKNLVV